MHQISTWGRQWLETKRLWGCKYWRSNSSPNGREVKYCCRVSRQQNAVELVKGVTKCDTLTRPDPRTEKSPGRSAKNWKAGNSPSVGSCYVVPDQKHLDQILQMGTWHDLTNTLIQGRGLAIEMRSCFRNPCTGASILSTSLKYRFGSLAHNKIVVSSILLRPERRAAQIWAPIPWQYNMLTRGAGGRAAPVPSLSEVVPMSTYEELSLIVSVALLIVAILNLTHKK